MVEFRQYTLLPGMRDVLIELFEREFVESQEALGMRLLGQFRDLDNPDRFVWLRAFGSFEQRATALHAFYHGPVWRTHRDAANATMLDSDDVLLLRTVQPFELPASRPAVGTLVPTVYTVTINPRGVPHPGRVVARFETDPTPNNFPQLPVRTDLDVSVHFQRFPSEASMTGPPPTLRLSPTPRSLLR